MAQQKSPGQLSGKGEGEHQHPALLSERRQAAANPARRAPLGDANSDSDAGRIAHLEAAEDFSLRPPNASRLKMRDFQTKLGVDDVTWNFIYIYTCDALATARPDYNCNRKAQKLAKFAKGTPSTTLRLTTVVALQLVATAIQLPPPTPTRRSIPPLSLPRCSQAHHSPAVPLAGGEEDDDDNDVDSEIDPEGPQRIEVGGAEEA
ncbi:hypothetical protein B0H14DRAFT_2597918 [Mycena olivaceomarginata]|nr:hypothetical protein B0H14DRAFT_2597918 [Mycena olivaceomarginata]